jgi:REP element-mobilizing transposase RayT
MATRPRRIVPGKTYLVTRRCLERRFFLRPDRKSEGNFPYVLAHYAQRHGIQIHAYCVLSNHLHLVLTDTRGRLPAFQQDLGSVLAKSTNACLGRWDTFWEAGSYSAVALENDAAVEEKLVYLLANPVAAGLVRHASEWPGHWSDPHRIGAGPVTIERPTEYFDDEGEMPPSAQLELTPPPGFEKDPTFVDRLLESLRRAEDSAAASLGRQGRSFMGVAKVLAQKFLAKPAPGEPRRQLNPRVACKDESKRVAALRQLAEFAHAYGEALDAWRKGKRDALFPPGTWLMRVLHGAPCADSC